MSADAEDRRELLQAHFIWGSLSAAAESSPEVAAAMDAALESLANDRWAAFGPVVWHRTSRGLASDPEARGVAQLSAAAPGSSVSARDA